MGELTFCNFNLQSAHEAGVEPSLGCEHSRKLASDARGQLGKDPIMVRGKLIFFGFVGPACI